MSAPGPAAWRAAEHVYVIDSPATVPGQTWHLEVFLHAADAVGHTAHTPTIDGRGTSNGPAAAALESGRVSRVEFGLCTVRRVEVKASRWQ